MLMLTLANFCLSMSNLPWFMDLIFQVLMQYCSLQHWTLLSPPVTSTTGHCFCFGSASSFFLELFCHSSISTFGTYQPGKFIFQLHIFLLFHTIHRVLKARMLKMFVIPFSRRPCFVRPLHHNPSILGNRARQGSWFSALWRQKWNITLHLPKHNMYIIDSIYTT